MLTAHAQSLLQELQNALSRLEQDEPLLQRVAEANPWFVPGLSRRALEALRQLCDPRQADLLAEALPSPTRPLRVGIIMAGNVPLVGLHDLAAVLLAGHLAVVKCSSRDALLLPALMALCSPETQARVAFVQALEPQAIDFLLATGGDTTALHIAHDFAMVPQVVRHNRFSLARLKGLESPDQLASLAEDILLYHGMGCRSVSSLLVPADWNPEPLVKALEDFDRSLLSADWWSVVAWEKAEAQLRGESLVPCRIMAVRWEPTVRPAKVGCLHLTVAADEAAAQELVAPLADKLQCCVGLGNGPSFGACQQPTFTDFPDGVNVLEVLQQQ